MILLVNMKVTKAAGHDVYPKDNFVSSILVLRATVSSAQAMLLFIALQMIYLTEATILNLTYPILTSIIAAMVGNEKFTMFHFLNTLVSFFGIILVVRPPF